MLNEPLVSIITPCYNGEKYLIPYFESILNQDYHNIELIFINDGSTDATEQIALGYGKKLVERGVQFRYIVQKNAGQAAAINQGLQTFAGDYLMWVDSDDVLYPEHISKKVLFLEEHPEFGFALSQGECVNHQKMDCRIKVIKREPPLLEDRMFEDLIYERNVVFGPGTILVRRSIFLEAIPQSKINESRQGQNWQLMLPIAYTSKCGYLEEVLFKCIEHGDSHSRKKRNYQEWVERLNGFEELLLCTVNGIPSMTETEKNEWSEKIKVRITVKKLHNAYRFLKLSESKEFKLRLKKMGYVMKLSDRLIVFWIIKIINKLRRLLSI